MPPKNPVKGVGLFAGAEKLEQGADDFYNGTARLAQRMQEVDQRPWYSGLFSGDKTAPEVMASDLKPKATGRSSPLQQLQSFLDAFDYNIFDWTNSREIRALGALQALRDDLVLIQNAQLEPLEVAARSEKAIRSRREDIQYAPHAIIKLINSVLAWVASLFGAEPFVFGHDDDTKLYGDNKATLEPLLMASSSSGM